MLVEPDQPAESSNEPVFLKALTAEKTWVEPKFLLLRRAMPRCAPPC